jgi:beta-ureidopropionase / N-carbamoyl-L-amino-acid hydrolase
VTFRQLWDTLATIGREPDGGYVRDSWTPVDLACRAWFTEQADRRGLLVETDNNGNLWAWLGDPAAGDAVVTGSHFDSVPHGGGYDGPLGIAAAFLALDTLRDSGWRPVRPVAVVAFTEEEGARFGVACLGSRLLTGAIDPSRAGGLRDRDGVSLLSAMRAAGHLGGTLGAAPNLLSRIGCFVELHIEQGRALTEPVGVATAIWPHGRWRLDFTGEGNHAGTTRMVDRRDPMLTYAYTVLAANNAARLDGAVATVGRVRAHPNATNAVPARVSAWLDARAPDEATLTALVDGIATHARERARRDGTTVTITEESRSSQTRFDETLRERIVAALGGAPLLPTGAGHDAGVLASVLPTAMLFVRNPSGVSHAPGESATDADCEAGVTALAAVLAELTCRP